MRRNWKRAFCLVVLPALLILPGCSDGTYVPLAKVDPVTPPPAAPQTPPPNGLQVSPNILPGVN